jgi:Flp pilus assembly protein TadG
VSALAGRLERALGQFVSLFRREGGNVAPLIALLIVPIVGTLAIGGETSSWLMMHRSQQNAADSAVLAAALNGVSTTYVAEARAVTASYGYPNGGNIVVTPSTVACPTGAPVVAGTLCYRVLINRTVPVYLTKVVGYTGDGTLVGGASGKLIPASAIAGTIPGSKNFCMDAKTSITLAGGNGTDLSGCDLLSAGNLTCNGVNSDHGVVHGYAHGTSTCGAIQISNYTGDTSDPEASAFATNLAATSMPSCPAGGTITSLPSGVNCFTGNVTLGANVTVNNPNTVLVIKPDASGNGSLIIGSNTLLTGPGGSLTVVYTGTNQLRSDVLVSNGGTINVAAPSTGNWKGMAIVEDPNLTATGTHLSIDYSGGANTITLAITGLIYLPNGTLGLKGGIDHAANSDHGTFAYDTCIGIVANNIVFKGTNAILANPTSGCRQAGLNLPTVPSVALLH